MTRKIYMLGLSIATCFAIVGCGDQARGEIRGTVTYKGQPVPFAIVIVTAADNQVYRADTDVSGKYVISGVPYGTARVAVQRPMLESEAPPLDDHPDAPGAPTGNAKSLPKVPTIPARYSDPATSDLKVDLAAPRQEFEIKLN